MIKPKSLIWLVVVIPVLIMGCTKEISPGDDPNFKIVENNDEGMTSFNRKVDVFGIPIYAAKKVDDDRLLHAANILAQYLDNDEDGVIDNPKIYNTMLNNNAFLVMWKRQRDLNKVNRSGIGQDLGNDETQPNWHANGQSGRFDAALEEVWHLITHAGYSPYYPAVFGESKGSELCNAMDIARGGQFTSTPASYPVNAWYSYDDKTCEYDCQATEYFYWAMTSILGAQKNRQNEIEHEWKLNTRANVEATDTSIYKILTDSTYHLPEILPDGSYKH